MDFFFLKEGVLIRTAWKCKKSAKTWDSCDKGYEILLPSEITVSMFRMGWVVPVICLAALLVAHLLGEKKCLKHHGENKIAWPASKGLWGQKVWSYFKYHSWPEAEQNLNPRQHKHCDNGTFQFTFRSAPSFHVWFHLLCPLWSVPWFGHVITQVSCQSWLVHKQQSVWVGSL